MRDAVGDRDALVVPLAVTEGVTDPLLVTESLADPLPVPVAEGDTLPLLDTLALEDAVTVFVGDVEPDCDTEAVIVSE